MLVPYGHGVLGFREMLRGGLRHFAHDYPCAPSPAAARFRAHARRLPLPRLPGGDTTITIVAPTSRSDSEIPFPLRSARAIPPFSTVRRR